MNLGTTRIITIILVIVILGGTPLIAGQMEVLTGPNRDNTNADVSIEQLVPDPDFSGSPSVVTNGSSGEFSSNYHSSTGLGDRNFVNLTFDHIANTSLDFKAAEDETYPDCNDFIYTYQEVEWVNNEFPLVAKVSVEFVSTHTGNFTQYAYDDYVELNCWIIDSSQSWTKVGTAIGFNWNDLQTWNFDFDFLEIRNLFDGMIDDGGGQDDPSDTIRVVLGISPRLHFYGSGEDGPWSYLNGSMTLQMFSLRFEIATGESEFEYDTYSPVGFGFWGGAHGVWSPDMAISDDNSVYAVGQMSDYEASISRHCLVKFDALGSLVWSRTLDRMIGNAVAVRGDDIYTVGRGGAGYDVALVKWNSAGTKIWNTTIDLGGNDYGLELAICADGSVIIVGDRIRGNQTSGYSSDAFILKTDSEGDLVWQTIHENVGIGYYEVFVDSDNRIFALNMNYAGITEWDQDGNFVESIYHDIVHTLTMTDDHFFVSQSLYQHGYFNITKITKEGIVVWTTSVVKQYGDLWADYLQADGITVSSEGSVYVIAKIFRFDLQWVLFKFDSTGLQEWNQSILSIQWRNLYSGIFGEIDLEMGKNNLLYVGGHWIPAEEVPTAIAVAVFNPEDAPVPLIIPLWLLVGGGAIAVIVVITIIFKLKRR